MTQKKSVLVVEDEADLASLVRFNLEKEGYACRVVPDGALVLPEVLRHPPHLILLDRMLPGLSGDEVIAQLKREPQTASIPVIMLTAKAEESDELIGFALGADDYVTKPFSMNLLVARVGAVLRRMEETGAEKDILTGGPIRLHASRFQVSVEKVPISLTATEFKLLKALMKANGRVLSRGRLIELAMGSQVAVTDRTIDVHVTALRKKLGSAASWVHTVRGIGYTFREPS